LIATVCRKAKVNARWWVMKLLGFLVAILMTFFIPNPVFQVWAWIALIGGTLFILVQLILLVEFAHSWTESWMRNWNEDPHKKIWWVGLLVSMIALYLLTFTLIVTEYVIFVPSHDQAHDQACSLNSLFITINLLLIILESGMSILPQIQAVNPNSGLLQSATVGAYTSYLIWSALMSQPEGSCHHLTSGKESFSAIAGAMIVFISVCYSAFRVSTKSERLLCQEPFQRYLQHQDLDQNQEQESDLEKSILEKSILDDQTDPDQAKEEAEEKAFNYTFFHICFALASCYVAMLITNWMIVRQEDDQDDQEIYVIDRSLGSMCT